MDPPTEALYNLRVDMFEREGGEALWKFWNPYGTKEEYEYEKSLWVRGKGTGFLTDSVRAKEAV